MNIKEVHRQFINECQDGTLKIRSDVTIESYRNAFRLFIKRFPIQNTTEVNEGVLRQFFRWGEQERNWTPSTVATYRKNLSVFFDWCMKRGSLHKDPLKDIPYPVIPKRLPEFYSEEEIQKILYYVDTGAYSDFVRSRNMAILGVFLMAGLRKGELIGLKVSDVDFETECIRICAETAKNRSPRAIKMTSRLKELLLKYWDARRKKGVETFSFWASSTKGGDFSEHGLKHMLMSISEQCGIKIKPHKFRHTYATKFYQGSSDIVGLSQTLGHKSIETTMIYAHAVPEKLKHSLESNPLNHYF